MRGGFTLSVRNPDDYHELRINNYFFYDGWEMDGSSDSEGDSEDDSDGEE